MSQTHPPETSDAVPDTLEQLLQRLRPRLKRVLTQFRIPPQDSEDLLQEALTAAFQKWDTVYNKEHWLLGTIRYRCILYWKKQRALREEAMDAADLESLSEPQPPDQDKLELRQEFASITRSLGPHHRTALWLRYAAGLSTSEVAKVMGYCPATMRKLLQRCLKRLQESMAEEPSQPRGPDRLD